jgi:hypothetical protein
MTNSRHRACLAPVVILCLAAAFDVYAAPVERIPSLAKALLLDTLKELVSIESGSGDREGLDKLAALKAPRRQEAGMAAPLPNSAHGDQLICAKPRGTARFLNDLHM